MPEIGQSLLHYSIVEKIGRGGMGEVYRAKDQKLGRDVAIKVLPEEFARDTDRVARFQREAKLLASLNHPNIAAIHGLEESGGMQFLVLELVEGRTLAEQIKSGPIPVEEALKLALQIAEALEAAHEKGVIHRDLKPANIKVTPDGKVKVLDFGLAKALETGPALDVSTTLTESTETTREGIILGTAPYMSPEQASGKRLDARTDIWSFGCILYECLTGKKAFQGETVTETLAGVIKGEPDWSRLPQETPAEVLHVLQRCLQKDPKLRYHDIADAWLDMEALTALPAPARASPRRLSFVWLATFVVAALLAGILVGPELMKFLRPASPPPVVTTILKIQPGHWLDGMRSKLDLERPSRTAIAVASDGSFIVYSAISENPAAPAKPQIYLRRMDRMEAAPIPGSEGGFNPFLSPDDRWLGFWEGDKLKKVPVSGGVPATLCGDSARPVGADWGPDNTIVFSACLVCGLSRVSSEGGQAEVLTVPDKGKDELNHRLPHYLPNGRGVLFTILEGNDLQLQPHLSLLDLRTRKWRKIMEDAADGRYLPTGHLVFLRQGTLMAVTFDLDRLEVTGQPVPIVASVMQALNSTGSLYNSGAGQYSISNSGWLAYVAGGIIPDRENSLVHVDQKGNVQPAVDFKAPFAYPRFSPDGRRIAYQTQGKDWQAWIYDRSRAAASRLTKEGCTRSGVAWTPDGERLVFSWAESAKIFQQNLYWQPADGSSAMERLTALANFQRPGSFTPDGATLAFCGFSYENGPDILLLDMKSRQVRPFLVKAFDAQPEFSPDGRWLAYESDESGRMEVWVRPFPGPGGRWQISKEGGQEPLWSKNGKQLFYRQADQVWVVDIRTDGGFSAGKPRMLFEKPGFSSGGHARAWDLWPDGRGFLMVKLDRNKQPATEMVVVQNWFEELKRLVPIMK